VNLVNIFPDEIFPALDVFSRSVGMIQSTCEYNVWRHVDVNVWIPIDNFVTLRVAHNLPEGVNVF
jgi:hypothetical protein